MQREERKRQIQAFKYERIINSTLVRRLSDLLSAMKLYPQATHDSPVDSAFKIIMEQTPANHEGDQPPSRPENVFDDDQPLPSYSKMMARILDEIHKTLQEKRVEEDVRYESFTEEIGVHLRKVQGLQDELGQQLDALEKEDSKKITSESYHTGFGSSHVNKAKPSAQSGEATDVELLNPGYNRDGGGTGSSIQSQTNLGGGSNEESHASPAALKFAQIPSSEYQASYHFLSSLPEILQESETDGLLAEAFNAALDSEADDTKVQQYVHQALLLQYCRLLGRGREGVAVFFKRITTPMHQARQMFETEVAEKFQRIKLMAKKSAKRLAEKGGEAVEQIQLHAVEPGTLIQIRIPPKTSETDEEKKARAIFESFAPDMKTALETGSLAEINKVLGAMDISEAEHLVTLLGDARFSRTAHASTPPPLDRLLTMGTPYLI